MATLTTANSALTLSVRKLFFIPQSIEGYATDDAFSTDNVQPVQIQMGVDGKLSAGFVPYPTILHIHLQADSPSMLFFDEVLAAQIAASEAYVFDGTCILQGTGEKFVFTKGYLTDATPMAAAQKTLQAREFTITFEKVSKAPL